MTGFIEERMNGQRVVKVFNHERKSEEEFDKLNESLFESAANANKYANIMGPVVGNIGNLQFVLTAVLGGVLAIEGIEDHIRCHGIIPSIYKEFHTAIYAGRTAV